MTLNDSSAEIARMLLAAKADIERCDWVCDAMRCVFFVGRSLSSEVFFLIRSSCTYNFIYILCFSPGRRLEVL